MISNISFKHSHAHMYTWTHEHTHMCTLHTCPHTHKRYAHHIYTIKMKWIEKISIDCHSKG